MGGGVRVNGSPTSAGFDRRRVTLRFRATFPSASDSVPRIVARIVAAARKGGFLGEGRTDFEIALHEAIANAVLHGNQADPSRSVRVRLYGQPGYGVVVAVRDQGPGFDVFGIDRGDDGADEDNRRTLQSTKRAAGSEVRDIERDFETVRTAGSQFLQRIPQHRRAGRGVRR